METGSRQGVYWSCSMLETSWKGFLAGLHHAGKQLENAGASSHLDGVGVMQMEDHR